MKGETIERGYLGVEITSLTRAYRESMGLSADTKGAFINSVTPGGPAERGGIQAGDIVLSLNGEAIDSSTELTRLVGRARAGDTLRMEVLRDGRRQTVNVRSGTRPSETELNARTNGQSEEGAAPQENRAAGSTVAGLNVAPVTDALRQRYSIPATVNGLVITGTETGARETGLRAGMVILRAGTSQAARVADLEAAVAEARRAGRNSLFLLVWTPQRGNLPVVLDLPKQ